MSNDAPPLVYNFNTPQQIVFGWGRRREIATLAQGLGRRAVLVYAPALAENGALDEIERLLAAGGVSHLRLAAADHEPEVADVDRATADLVRAGGGPDDFLLGIGGGAAIDLAKAVAAMTSQRENATVKDYLENVGRDLKLVHDPLPILAMPTTAGTGAEATRNAVISSYDPPFKKSLRSEKIMPRIALVDPELCVTAPPSVTAASGMDAITQLVESTISRKAQPIPRALAIAGLRRALSSIAEAVENPTSRPARENMSHAALLSGMALANSGLGMAHGVAAALGVHARAPHGLACAILLPVAIEVNLPVCARELAELARAFLPLDNADDRQAAVALQREIAALCRRVGIPGRLSELGVRRDQIPAIVRDSRGSSMSGNPRELSDKELTAILEGLLDDPPKTI